MKNVSLFALLLLVFASGCREFSPRRERGSGTISSQSRSVSGFNSIQVSGAIDVYVRQDSSTSVRIDADDNLQQYVEVYTDNSTLVIHVQNGIRVRPSRKIKVYVSNPEYREFQASGASSFIGETVISSGTSLHVDLSGASDGKLDVDAPRISVTVSGASNITMSGKTKDFEGGASGASEIKCFNLLAENSDMEVNGASSAEVYASVKLEGHASGASHIRYKGNASTSISSSGASGVNKVD